MEEQESKLVCMNCKNRNKTGWCTKKKDYVPKKKAKGELKNIAEDCSLFNSK